MSLLQPIMRARILNASRPLSRQLRATFTTTPVTRNILQEQEPTTRQEVPDLRRIKTLDTHHTKHPSSATATLFDYSGADSENNYKVRTNDFQHRRTNTNTIRSSILDLMAENSPPRHVSRQMVLGLGYSLEQLEDLYEQYREYAEKEEKLQAAESRFLNLVRFMAYLGGCLLGNFIVHSIGRWMIAERKVVSESDVD